MLFHTKKIKKSLFRRSTPDDILRCHLFAKFPQILFELCSRKQSLKKYLILSVSKIIGNERQNDDNLLLVDDFNSEFEDCVYFLRNEEDTLTELERNFKVFVFTKFPHQPRTVKFFGSHCGLFFEGENEMPEIRFVKKNNDRNFKI